jgi:hypothetical protein
MQILKLNQQTHGTVHGYERRGYTLKQNLQIFCACGLPRQKNGKQIGFLRSRALIERHAFSEMHRLQGFPSNSVVLSCGC